MGLRYHDEITGRDRIKPRYLYAMSFFVIGTLFGMLLTAIF
jgi:hypothetical protein